MCVADTTQLVTPLHDDTAATTSLLVSFVSCPVGFVLSLVTGVLDIALGLLSLVLGIALHVGKGISSLVICSVHIVV